MDEDWIAKRSQLLQLLNDQPRWTNAMYASMLGMSVSWVKDWKRVFRQAGAQAADKVLGRPRHRRTPFEQYAPEVIQAVLDIRDHPPDYCPRTPGPKVIQYALSQHFTDGTPRYPRSTSTLWRILDAHQRILRRPAPEHEPFERPAPMHHWEIDFADIPNLQHDPDGKQQHAVEMFNVMDRGTSILVESTAASDYTAETTLLALTEVFIIHGIPEAITLDRDPRFTGGWQGDDFPSAFIRYLKCIGITQVDLCPPRRPDLKPFVERVHRTIKEESLRPHPPADVQAARQQLRAFRWRYNHERPHQSRACSNRPPYTAFPVLPLLPRLPEVIDPDHWLKGYHGRTFKRKVGRNGSIQLNRHRYYVGRAWAGQTVVLKVDAPARQLQVIHQRQTVKSLAIKGLHGQSMAFEDYLRMISREAETEWREVKRLVRQRRLDWAA